MKPSAPTLAVIFTITASLSIQRAEAALMAYSITGDITEAPNAPGTFDSNPWQFDGGTTFAGSFLADDTVAGGISNLSLVIGGLDVASSHPIGGAGRFSPDSLSLLWIGSDPSGRESAVKIGGLESGTTNRILAIQGTSGSDLGPPDPDGKSTLNWLGTFQIEKMDVPVADRDSASVPDHSSFALTALLGIGSVIGLKLREQKRRQGA